MTGGGYVVQRLALDHPQSVDRIVILGDVPIGEVLVPLRRAVCPVVVALVLYGAPAPLAERLIAADVDAWYGLGPTLMGEENYADVARAVANPAVQHAMCEDYRAGLGVDRAADDADRNAGRKITSPLLVLWGTATTSPTSTTTTCWTSGDRGPPTCLATASTAPTTSPKKPHRN